MEWTRALLAALVVLVAPVLGCASDEETTVCDQAVDKYKDCGFAVDGGENLNCSGEFECAQNCALSASCQDIKLADPSSGYQKCLDGCKGK